MSKFNFRPKTVVKRKSDDLIGVVCPDLPGMLNCNGPDEVGVVFGGQTAAFGTDWSKLEVIGPEDAVADPDKCGAGKGDECCIFLVVGSEGFSCARFGSLHWDLQFRRMEAKRHPNKLFPNCQLKVQ